MIFSVTCYSAAFCVFKFLSNSLYLTFILHSINKDAGSNLDLSIFIIQEKQKPQPKACCLIILKSNLQNVLLVHVSFRKCNVPLHKSKACILIDFAFLSSFNIYIISAICKLSNWTKNNNWSYISNFIHISNMVIYIIWYPYKFSILLKITRSSLLTN